MEEVLKKEKNKKYDFSNAESQKLFEEFTLLLTDITKYVESQDNRIIFREEELKQVQNKYNELEGTLKQVQDKYEELEKELKKIQGKYEKSEEELKQVQDKQKELLAELESVSSGRYMLKAILKKSVKLVYRIISFIPRKLINKFKRQSK